MSKLIKSLIAALSFGLLTISVMADDPCPPPCADENHNNICDEDEKDPNSDSMPQGLVVDDMPSEIIAGS